MPSVSEELIKNGITLDYIASRRPNGIEGVRLCQVAAIQPLMKEDCLHLLMDGANWMADELIKRHEAGGHVCPNDLKIAKQYRAFFRYYKGGPIDIPVEG